MTRARLTTLKSKYIYNIYIHQITVIVGSNQIVVSSPPDRNTAQFDPTMTKKSLTYSGFKLEHHYQHVFTMFNNELWQAQSWGERCPSARRALSWTEPHPYSLSFVAWFCLGNPKRYRRAVTLTHGGKASGRWLQARQARSNSLEQCRGQHVTNLSLRSHACPNHPKENYSRKKTSVFCLLKVAATASCLCCRSQEDQHQQHNIKHLQDLEITSRWVALETLLCSE